MTLFDVTLYVPWVLLCVVCCQGAAPSPGAMEYQFAVHRNRLRQQERQFAGDTIQLTPVNYSVSDAS
jgi:hypothetical protein